MVTPNSFQGMWAKHTQPSTAVVPPTNAFIKTEPKTALWAVAHLTALKLHNNMKWIPFKWRKKRVEWWSSLVCTPVTVIYFSSETPLPEDYAELHQMLLLCESTWTGTLHLIKTKMLMWLFYDNHREEGKLIAGYLLKFPNLHFVLPYRKEGTS